ncbi:unnamed protein product [Cyclocybe aegerita]|uniref:Uncharacterized protein n=1 Tax=Cyclocybe aegerita TaxID=1973307 RepID=A0A8S0XZR5_CYCAE|nr:unnamed protein product [Cyclocybe aegerita]
MASDGRYNKAVMAFGAYNASRNEGDLKSALSHFQETIRLLRRTSHPKLALALTNYAYAQWIHCERNGKPEVEVKSVIELYEEARRVWKKDSTVLHTNLRNAYLEMYAQQRSRTDMIANAIKCHEQARHPSSDGKQKQKVVATIKPATALSTRREQQSNTNRLDKAIAFLEDTSKFFKPGSDDFHHAHSEYELGNAYNVRYKRGGNVRDLNLGILHFRNAIDSYPEGDEDGCFAQFALSQTQLVLYHALNDPRDLEEEEVNAGNGLEQAAQLSNAELERNFSTLIKHVRSARE